MHKMIVPVMPNKPLNSLSDEDVYGKISLRLNTSLNFLENASFDSHLLTYDKNYQNSQGCSDRFQAHMNEVVVMLRDRFSKGQKVVEVGCGKGDFFNLLCKEEFFQTTGFDAAYEGSNPNIQKRFLTSEDDIKADLIVLRHTLEHIPEPHKFLQFLKKIFKKAKIYIEVPDLNWILENQAFIDITYEHVNYFSRDSLVNLFSAKDVEWGSLFDSQYQYVIADIEDVSDDFAQKYDADCWKSIDFQELFPQFIERITFIDGLLTGNRKAYIWGAATKGCMFLVHCLQLRKILNKLEFAIDINPKKIGKFLPCSNVPIKSKEDFFQSASNGDLLIISNPTYKNEIINDIERSNLKEIEIVTL